MAAPPKASTGSAARPKSKASLLYRLVRLLVRFLAFGVFRFQIATSGQEHIPPGGYLLVAAAHRGWMDPFVVIHALPVEPRSWFLGSGAVDVHLARGGSGCTTRLGGLLPVWRGGVGIEPHIASAKAVLANGGVFVQMPEGTVSGPPGRLGPMRPGWAIIAMRTDAPVLPLAMAGTEELYIGRRMASRVLPATSARELAGLEPGAPFPEPGIARGAGPGPPADRSPRRAPGTGRRGAAPRRRRSARPSAPPAAAPDVAAPQPGRLDRE